MKDLNQVQKALERKCKLEIQEAVTKIKNVLSEMEDKYNPGSGYEITKINPWDKTIDKEISFSELGDLTKEIEASLTKKHMERMLEVKTKELLNKLEII